MLEQFLIYLDMKCVVRFVGNKTYLCISIARIFIIILRLF